MSDRIDMVAFCACWAARESAEPKPICVVVKSVADFGDEEKADGIQDYCSFTSAAIAMIIAQRLLSARICFQYWRLKLS